MDKSPYGQPVGPSIPSEPAAYAQTTTIKGKHITLKPLQAHHAESLWANLAFEAHPENRALFTYLPKPDPETYAEFEVLINEFITNPVREMFVIVSPQTGPDATDNAVGLVSYLDISTVNREVEIGWVLFALSLQRTIASTECIYLLMHHAFETLQPPYRRVVWHCHALNAASDRAARRLGFVYEGTLRKHRVVKGRNRDTNLFAVLDDEWEVVGGALKTWLDDANFVDGRQVRRLEDIREDIKTRLS